MVFQTAKQNFQPQKPSGRPLVTRRPSLKLLFVTTTLVSTLLLCFVYINAVQDSPSEEIKNGNLLYTFRKILYSVQNAVQWSKTSKTVKPRILLWTPFFSNRDYLRSPKDVGCPVDCTVTSNRSLIKESDAIVLHLRNTDIADLPEWQNNKQRWVLFNMEAPPHTSIDTMRALNGKIHWTATYRRDSDIIVPYGKVVARRKGNNSEIPKFQEKRNLVCWIVSNCNTPSFRETYVEELRKYVYVATYGVCGTLSCPSDRSVDCYKEISKSCKFYLSFENSLCRDYMTEKVFNAMRTDMVPVVLSGSRNSLFLPNHSYIDAMDYGDPSELASFLQELDKNAQKLIEYHAWKRDYYVDQDMISWSCDLCKMLHDPSLQWTTHKDLVKWWFDDGNCFSCVQYFGSF